jgi:hypothetical protein
MQTPLRQVLVHDRDEVIVMMPLDEVREFVNNDIFKALHRLLSEFEVQPNSTSLDATGERRGIPRLCLAEFSQKRLKIGEGESRLGQRIQMADLFCLCSRPPSAVPPYSRVYEASASSNCVTCSEGFTFFRIAFIFPSGPMR